LSSDIGWKKQYILLANFNFPKQTPEGGLGLPQGYGLELLETMLAKVEA
jgi:hypothetical protein